MGHQEDALVNLDRAEAVAGEEAGNLRNPADQANYFVQRGILNALLHLADIIEVPQNEYRESIEEWNDLGKMDTPWPWPVEDDGANSATTYDGPSEPATVNERPSPTATILREPGTVERIPAPLPASSLEANRNLDPKDATTSEDSPNA